MLFFSEICIIYNGPFVDKIQKIFSVTVNLYIMYELYIWKYYYICFLTSAENLRMKPCLNYDWISTIDKQLLSRSGLHFYISTFLGIVSSLGAWCKRLPWCCWSILISVTPLGVPENVSALVTQISNLGQQYADVKTFFYLIVFFTHSSSFAKRHLSLQFPSLMKKTCVGPIPQCVCTLLLIPAFVIWLTGTEHSVDIKMAYSTTHPVIILELQIITSHPDIESLRIGNVQPFVSIIETALWSIRKACMACKSSVMSLNSLWRNQATLFGIAFSSLHLPMPDQNICLAQHLLYGLFTQKPIVQKESGMH